MIERRPNTLSELLAKLNRLLEEHYAGLYDLEPTRGPDVNKRA
jgi:hypothetical protein